jgi:hypothetical protein
MVVEAILKLSPPLREQAERRQKPLNEPAPTASFTLLNQNIEPDAASTARLWPRVFPGL